MAKKKFTSVWDDFNALGSKGKRGVFLGKAMGSVLAEGILDKKYPSKKKKR